MPYSETEYEAMEGMEGWESESEASWEAARRGGPKRPSSQPSYKPRPQPGPSTANYVTQTQLQAALVRVDGKIKTLSDGVSTVNSRVASLAAAVKKEADERKKTTETQGKDLNQKVQLLALLPLLLTPSTGTTAAPLTVGGTTTATGGSVLVPSSSSLNAILPILLVSGLGGSSGSSGSSGFLGLGGDGGDSGLLLILALVLAFSGGLGH